MSRRDSTVSFLILLVLLLSFSFCTSNRRGRIKPLEHSLKKPPSPVFYQRGIASWYGKKFQGRRTANGEIYDMYKLTAAHKLLPFHSFVEVENLNNGKKVVVRINDRGPFVKNRIIDLSYKAALRIGMSETGTAPVLVRILKSPGSSAVKPEPENKTRISFIIQTGAFSSRRNARRLLEKLENLLPRFKFRIVHQKGYFKIFSGELKTREEAEKVLDNLARHQIDAFIKTLHR